MSDDQLLQRIAEQAAERASHACKKKSKGEQLAVWQQTYDAVLSGLLVYAEIIRCRVQRWDRDASIN